MADPPRLVKAAFPAPPPFYKHFTAANVSKVQHSDGPKEDIQGDLCYLTPPTPPRDGKYRSFGIEHNLTQPAPTLADSNIQQLYPSDTTDSSDKSGDAQIDPTPHLLSLSRSILLNFLELTGILSVNSAQYADKIDHLQTLYYNVHHLINQYRPHQARESLILLMEEQLQKHKDEIATLNECEAKMARMLKTIQETGATAQQVTVISTTDTHRDRRPDDQEVQRQTQLCHWSALEQELG